jgi:hypothetical protein
MLRGDGPETCRSGDQSELRIDCGDTQYWDLSYGTFEDDENKALLQKMGVKVTYAEEITYEIMDQIRDGKLNRLGALVVYDIPEEEFDRLRGKGDEW